MILDEQRFDRLLAAQDTLRGWYPARTAPEIMASGLSVLQGGAPSVIYTISKNGAGPDALAAMERLTLERVSATPFMRENLLFSQQFTLVTEDESLWGAKNRAILGEDLRQDGARWQIFNGALLRPLDLGDNIRIIFSTAGGSLLGWCGSFTTGGRKFTEEDRTLLDAYSASLGALVYAWDALAPAFGECDPLVEFALMWPAPAFAVTLRGDFLFANRAARRDLLARPAWLDDALNDPTATPPGWSLSTIAYDLGSIAIFMQRRRSFDDWFIESIVDGLNLPAYLSKIARLAVKGCTYEEIATMTERSLATITTYMARIRRSTHTTNRAELIYEAICRMFSHQELRWPIVLRRTSWP